MSISDQEISQAPETFEQKLERLRATPEERARILENTGRYDYGAWLREVGPSSPEELAEMEEFLKDWERGRRGEKPVKL